jgi:hypothetical protein
MAKARKSRKIKKVKKVKKAKADLEWVFPAQITKRYKLILQKANQ